MPGGPGPHRDQVFLLGSGAAQLRRGERVPGVGDVRLQGRAQLRLVAGVEVDLVATAVEGEVHAPGGLAAVQVVADDQFDDAAARSGPGSAWSGDRGRRSRLGRTGRRGARRRFHRPFDRGRGRGWGRRRRMGKQLMFDGADHVGRGTGSRGQCGREQVEYGLRPERNSHVWPQSIRPARYVSMSSFRAEHDVSPARRRTASVRGARMDEPMISADSSRLSLGFSG